MSRYSCVILKQNRHRNFTPLTARSSLRPVTRAPLAGFTQSAKKDLDRLQYLNEYLQLALKKKEEILSVTLQENKELREEIFRLQNIIKTKDIRLGQMKNAQYEIGMSKPDIPKYHKPTRDDLFESIKLRLGPVTVSYETKTALASLKSISENIMPAERPSFFLDPNGFPRVLSFDTLEEVINSERFKFLKHVLSDQKTFLETITQMQDKEIEFLIDIFKGLVGDIQLLFQTVKKQRHLSKGFLSISYKVDSEYAFAKNVELICEVLNCDRASIFLHDKMKNTLWSVYAKGGRKIESPANSGIAGSVFTSGKPVNIEDVYLDKRFNKEVDIKNNYRSKSMLCVPIWNNKQKIIGVCQAINSKNGVFSKDDEKLFELLSKNAGNSLIDSIEYKEQGISYELLKRVNETAMQIYEVKSQEDLLERIELGAKKIFGTDIAYLYIVHKGSLYRSESGKITQKRPVTGLLGLAVKKNQLVSYKRTSEEPDFNPLVDIDTNGRVKCVPVYSEERKEVVLAIELLNKKLCMHVDKEIMEFFIKLVTAAIKVLQNFPIIDDSLY